MPPDELLRRYVTILESARVPAQLFFLAIPKSTLEPKSQKNLPLADQWVDATVQTLRAALMDTLIEGGPYERRSPVWPYGALNDFVGQCLEQPVAIEQSPVSGKSLVQLAKAGAFLTISYATGHDASSMHSVVPILDVGGSVIVIGSSLAVVNRVSEWLDHIENRPRR